MATIVVKNLKDKMNLKALINCLRTIRQSGEVVIVWSQLKFNFYFSTISFHQGFIRMFLCKIQIFLVFLETIFKMTLADAVTDDFLNTQLLEHRMSRMSWFRLINPS